MTPKDKPKRGGAKSFERATKPGSATKGKPTGKAAFSAKAGLKQRPVKEVGKSDKPVAKQPAKAATAPVEAGGSKPERISKILARAGVASRRDVERMIMEGRVRLNGTVLETPVVNATLEDRIEVDGQPIRGIERTRLWLYHKPRGLVTTNSDPEGRPTVFEHLPADLPRVVTIGRLDINTEGLLLLTNDGELAHRLMHPSYEVPKSYVATVLGSVPRGLGRKLREGVELDDGPVQVDDFALVDTAPGRTLVRVTLHEGRKHIVRRLLAEVGFPVQDLVRTDIGGVALGDQRPGSIRALTQKEIGELYKAVGL